MTGTGAAHYPVLQSYFSTRQGMAQADMATVFADIQKSWNVLNIYMHAEMK